MNGSLAYRTFQLRRERDEALQEAQLAQESAAVFRERLADLEHQAEHEFDRSDDIDLYFPSFSHRHTVKKKTTLTIAVRSKPKNFLRRRAATTDRSKDEKTINLRRDTDEGGEKFEMIQELARSNDPENKARKETVCTLPNDAGPDCGIYSF